MQGEFSNAKPEAYFDHDRNNNNNKDIMVPLSASQLPKMATCLTALPADTVTYRLEQGWPTCTQVYYAAHS